MGERGVRNAEVRGSSPLISTKFIVGEKLTALLSGTELKSYYIQKGGLFHG